MDIHDIEISIRYIMLHYVSYIYIYNEEREWVTDIIGDWDHHSKKRIGAHHCIYIYIYRKEITFPYLWI